MSKRTQGIARYTTKFIRLLGSLVYTVFKTTAWIITLGALALAAVFYMGGVTELIAGTLRVAAGTAIVYLIVTMLVKRLFFNSSRGAAPQADQQEVRARPSAKGTSMHKHARAKLTKSTETGKIILPAGNQAITARATHPASETGEFHAMR
jgi:hypothetical protein